MQLALGACWGRRRADISVGVSSTSSPPHGPGQRLPSHCLPSAPPGCRDPEGFLCNVLFLKRDKSQTAGGLWGGSSPYREWCENNWLQQVSEVPGRTPASRALPEFPPLVSYGSCTSHQSQEFGQTPGDAEGQGSPACCGPWGCRELDTTGWLTTSTPSQEAVGRTQRARSRARRLAGDASPQARAASSSWCRISNTLRFAV